MKILLFYHSLVSDWNHGNAHFLRGIAGELQQQGHEVQVYEPAKGWSAENLVKDHGIQPLQEFHRRYPGLASHRYERLDLPTVLAEADLVIVHEWNAHELVGEIGRHCPKGCVLFFHDTHHRAVTDPRAMEAYDLSRYHGVLAYGAVLRDIYVENGWASRAWVWHEAADTARFRPLPRKQAAGDLVWIGNWGDEERTAELEEFFITPVQQLGLRAAVYGVRYPAEAKRRLAQAGIDYHGWLPNYRVPEVFAEFKATIHVPRRPYATGLPGIPTIRPFEALACGIPLVSAPWEDVEGLFTPGKDFLIANNGEEMAAQLSEVLNEPMMARTLCEHGLRTVRQRHTCRHRVEELLTIYQEMAAIYG